MSERSITIDNKTYVLAPIKFSPDSVALLEILEKLLDRDEEKISALDLIKATRLTYSLILDCLIRAGTEREDAVQALAGATIDMETIQGFIGEMITTG